MASLRDKITGWNSPLTQSEQKKDSKKDKENSIKTSAEDTKEAHLAFNAQRDSSRAKLAQYNSKKAHLHQSLISRIDLSSLEILSPKELRQKIRDVVTKLIVDEGLTINDQERLEIIIDLQNEVLGLGPLEPLLADPTISEIMVNKFDTVYVERKGKLQLSETAFDDEDHLLRIIDKIVSRVGRRIDESSPMADARLPDGSRVNAIIPPLALDGSCLTVRRFSAIPLQMQDLIDKNSVTDDMAELLAGLVKAKTNILISGGTGSGKTTLLNILSGYIPESERIITIEDTAELQLQQPHVVRLETRQANIEGRGEVSMRVLVKNSLRMRPNRVVIGEVRGEEVIDMLQAMNTGHDGSLATIHANNPRDALGRLENLISMSGVNMPSRSQRQQISSAIQVIVQVNRVSDGTRKITSITELTGIEGEVITMQEIFKYNQLDVNAEGIVQGDFSATGVRPKLAELLKSRGVEFREDMFDPTIE